MTRMLSKPRPDGFRQDAFSPLILVANSVKLAALQEALKTAAQIAVDTESNSLYVYHERICLIQISTGQADFLVDALAFNQPSDLQCLADVFSNPNVEKIFHAAEYDLMGLRRDFGFTFTNIFDTMIAARMLGGSNLGLGAILNEHFGVQLNKRFQRANWGIRPLSPQLLEYAQMDSHFLLPLRHHLNNDLAANQLLDEAAELFLELTRMTWRPKKLDPDDWWRLDGATALPVDKRGILLELVVYRDMQARHLNVPVFKILSDSSLVALAGKPPHSINDLTMDYHLSDKQIGRWGKGILEAVARGTGKVLVTSPYRPRRVDEQVLRRFETLRKWRKDRAQQRGVPSDIIMSKDALWAIARLMPLNMTDLYHANILGPWRLKTYGEEVVAVLSANTGAQDEIHSS